MLDHLTLKTPAGIIETDLKTGKNDNVTIEALTMTREKCMSRELVDSFFRLLRHNSDDVIKQKLNNIDNLSSKAKEARCGDFVQRELFPSWDLRHEAINFCEREAQLMKKEIDGRFGSSHTVERPVLDARMDPYAAADSLSQKESYYHDWRELTRWIQNQREIEEILQKNGASVLNRACDPDVAYIDAFKKFQLSLGKK
ncbi:Mix23p [Lachancea thermotolerans CBS 6340]|uniref:KLTH0C05434p n=1 Tax=Lachancea thermotolerans (strain ATCC 56472 / CBS 6340 / NRRL Y-8284) TaxID=559295 RepID=C5DE12_LACTC|nr:KLTH0C05434p [Lachancea thermotolerans CBS 6340]CAR22023.1 KLTH0C05434p [Lachancea thermotolerans CBS 6340]